MKKILLKLAAVWLILSGSLVSCEKEEGPIDGVIVAYSKCPGYVVYAKYPGDGVPSNDIKMGLYIVSSKKDSLLTFNLSPSTMEYLLDASIDTLEGGDPVKINHIPVDFNYRKAVNKIETACVYPAMSAPDKLLQSTQIIILTIDKK